MTMKKYLFLFAVVEMHEKSGGRHQTFTVESEDIVRARVINELKVK